MSSVRLKPSRVGRPDIHIVVPGETECIQCRVKSSERFCHFVEIRPLELGLPAQYTIAEVSIRRRQSTGFEPKLTPFMKLDLSIFSSVELTK